MTRNQRSYHELSIRTYGYRYITTIRSGMIGFGLGSKTNVFDRGLEVEVLGLHLES